MRATIPQGVVLTVDIEHRDFAATDRDDFALARQYLTRMGNDDATHEMRQACHPACKYRVHSCTGLRHGVED
jgi:hypothetical protein